MLWDKMFINILKVDFLLAHVGTVFQLSIQN